MKNLNKKIGVVALSGLVLIGGGLASGISVFAAKVPDSQRPEMLIKEVDINKLPKSIYESPWKLKPRSFNLEDYNVLKAYQGVYGYKIYDYDLSQERMDYLAKDKPHLSEVAKSFYDPIYFLNHMSYAGMSQGLYVVDIRGVKYLLGFNI